MRFMQIISAFLISSCIVANPLVAAELEFSTVEGVGGIPLNVVQTGNRDGFGILLIHGFGQGALAFKNQLHSDLAEEFHVVAFDMRGHATSGKPWRREDLVGSEIWGGDVAGGMMSSPRGGQRRHRQKSKHATHDNDLQAMRSGVGAAHSCFDLFVFVCIRRLLAMPWTRKWFLQGR